MNKTELENNIVDFVTKLGYQLMDFNVFKKVETYNISFSIYKKSGVTVKDCAKATISTRDFISLIMDEDFTLDVSSPGAERELRKYDEYDIFSGKKAKLILKNGDIITGFLGGIERDKNNVLFRKIEDENILIIPFNEINKCKLLL
jgi:ribosome maturation factor RimP